MAIDYTNPAVFAIPKPEPRKTSQRRDTREQTDRHARIRQYVFARERNICRVTRYLPAESMHELQFRSTGGKVSRANSIAVDGDGTRGIHGMLQRHEITYRFEHDGLGAEGTIIFTAKTQAAADRMRVQIGESIVSAPMSEVEAER